MRKYHTLDLMRAIAAVFVMLGHAELFTYGSHYLAVDMFFCLSGFVISHAYDRRLPGFVEFFRVRWTRLYPLYFLGLCLGLLVQIARIVLGEQSAMPPAEAASSFGLGLFMLPSSTTEWLFPLNPPAWSLFFEVAINLVYAVLFVFLSKRVLVIAAVIAAAGILWATVSTGSLGVGHSWPAAGFGIARAIYPFVIGVLINRVGFRLKFGGWWAPCAVLAAALAFVQHGGFSDAAFALVLVPLLVAWGAGVEPSFHRLAAVAGTASYSVYILHFPIVRVVSYLTDSKPLMVVALVLTVLACMVVDRIYDQPVRRWLLRKPNAARAVRQGA